MDELETFNYKGINVKIKKGMDLKVIDLNTRLQKMGIDVDTKKSNKTSLAKIYDTIINDDSSKIKIFDLLIKDTEMLGLFNEINNYVLNFKEGDEIIQKNEGSKAVLIKNEITDQNQIKYLNNSKNINNNNLSFQNNNNNPSNAINIHFNIPINNTNKEEKENEKEKETPRISEKTYIYDQNDTKSFFSIKTIILLIIISGFLLYFLIKNLIPSEESYRAFVRRHHLYDDTRETIWDFLGVMALLIFLILLLICEPKHFFYLWLSCIKNFFIFFYHLLFKCKQRSDFKKLCKKIFENIKETIKNKMDKCMCESEIIEIFSKQYFIEKDIFIKDYMHELNELRKKDPSFKLFKDWNSDGKKEIFWELSD